MKIDIFGIFGPKTEKMGHARKWLFLFCQFFLLNQKVQKIKNFSLPKWLCCAKKNVHLPKEKMDFWPFLWFCQNHNNGQKSIFSLQKWNFFSAPLNHLGRQIFWIFYTLWFDQKKWAKLKKTHFCAWPTFSVFGPKMPKISIFMKKSFSNNFSMSNFGQKRFSILLTNTYIWTH